MKTTDLPLEKADLAISKQDKKDIKLKKLEKLNARIEDEIGGPYYVNVQKPYKPVFILFIDLITAITYTNMTILFSWYMHVSPDDRTFKKDSILDLHEKVYFMHYR